MSDFNIEEFFNKPSVAALEDGLKRANWISLAEKYAVTIKRSWKKALIASTVVEYLVDFDVHDNTALKLFEGKDISVNLYLLPGQVLEVKNRFFQCIF